MSGGREFHSFGAEQLKALVISQVGGTERRMEGEYLSVRVGG